MKLIDLYKEWMEKGKLPGIDENVEVSDDGETVRETADYLAKRTCMMAGIGGGNGYFGKGFATDGSTGCERGLILSDITHWRYTTPLPAPPIQSS